jgi:hypothetical protein
MGTSETLVLIASAQDRASPALRQVTKAIADLNKAGGDLNKHQAALDKLNKSWVNLGNAARQSRDTQKHIRDLGDRYKEFAAQGSRVATMVGSQLTPAFSTLGITSITATGAVLGLVEAAKQFAAQSGNLSNFGKQFGFAIKDVQGLEGVAERFQVSGDVIKQTLSDISRQADQMRGLPGGGELLNKLRQTPGMQGAAVDIERIVKNPNFSKEEQNRKVLMRFLEEGKRIEQQRGKAYAGTVMESLGFNRAILNLPPEGQLEAEMAKVRKAQGELDPEAAKKFRESWADVTDVLIGARNQIGNELLPAITDLNNAVATFFADRGKNWLLDELKKDTATLKQIFDDLKKVYDFIQRGNTPEGVLKNIQENAAAPDPSARVKEMLGIGKGIGAPGAMPPPPPPEIPSAPEFLHRRPQFPPPAGSTAPPVVNVPPMAIGASNVTQSGLAYIHAGEQIRPAQAAGPYGAGPTGDPAKRTTEQNTRELHELNLRLQRIIEDRLALGSAGRAGGLGGGAGAGIGSGGGGAGTAGGTGPGAGSSAGATSMPPEIADLMKRFGLDKGPAGAALRQLMGGGGGGGPAGTLPDILKRLMGGVSGAGGGSMPPEVAKIMKALGLDKGQADAAMGALQQLMGGAGAGGAAGVLRGLMGGGGGRGGPAGGLPGILKQLMGGGGRGGPAGAGPPDGGEATAATLAQRNDKSIPASIRFNNPGAQWPSPESRRFGQTDRAVIGGGNPIAGFPSPVEGAASNMALLANKYKGMAIGAAIHLWSGGGRSSVPGYDPSTVISQDMLNDPKFMTRFFREMATAEAGRTKGTIGDEQLKQSFEMYKSGSAQAYYAAHPTKETAAQQGIDASRTHNKFIDAARSQHGLHGPGKTIALQEGGAGIVDRPTHFMAGEAGPEFLAAIPMNVMKFIKGIGKSETDFSAKEAYTDRYNRPSNNRNVKTRGQEGADTGFFQMNLTDVAKAIRMGVAPDIAKNLTGSGGPETMGDQMTAVDEYLKHRWPDKYQKLSEHGDFEGMRKAAKSTWFGLGAHGGAEARSEWLDHPVGSLGAKAEQIHKVEGSGHIKVDVNAPKGTHVKAASAGMFRTVKVNRQASMPRVDEQH